MFTFCIGRVCRAACGAQADNATLHGLWTALHAAFSNTLCTAGAQAGFASGYLGSFAFPLAALLVAR